MFSKDIHRRSGPWLGSWLPLFTRCSQVLGGSTAQVTSAATGSLRTNEATQHPPSRSRSFHLRRFVTLKGSKPGTATTPDMPPKMTGRERGVVEPDSPPDSGDRTALNMVRLTLQALCAISQSVGLPGVNLPFEALLTIFDKIVTVSQNHEGFRSLAQRLQSLRDIFNEISKTRNPPTDLLGGLEEELNKLCKDIQRAMSNNTLEQFINSSDDVLSLAAHDKTIRSMVGTLLLVVNGRTSQKVDELHDRSNDIMAGVNRIESMLSSKERTLLQSVPSQSFRGAKIDTRRVGSDRGGNIGSGNCGSLSQDFSEVEFITGGGAVGSGNANRKALFVACS